MSKTFAPETSTKSSYCGRDWPPSIRYRAYPEEARIAVFDNPCETDHEVGVVVCCGVCRRFALERSGMDSGVWRRPALHFRLRAWARGRSVAVVARCQCRAAARHV